ncbi:MAG: hypothetical protein HC853_09555 [Anaerolineae bacterium]|nr:hypothetical protein [Anaerolineae bacterium]
MPSLTKHRILLIGLPILAIVLLLGVAIVPRVATLLQSSHHPITPSPFSAQVALSSTLSRAAQARTYRYTSDVDQTLIPRAVPGMIGMQDQYMTLAIEGEVLAADRSRTTLQFDPGGISGIPNLLPVTIVRNGAELYVEREGQKQSFQNETLTAAPTDNVLDYLAVAENVKALEPKAVNGVLYTRIGFDVRGAAMAQQQIDRIKRVQPAAIVNVPDSLRNATGSGELWIAPDGLPARQIINLEMPQVSREFHARLQMRTSFADFPARDYAAFSASQSECADIGSRNQPRRVSWREPKGL